MRGSLIAFVLTSAALLATTTQASIPSPISVEIVAPDGRVFREIPINARDGTVRSYLQAEKGARYQVRVRNATGQRLGLVIAVDGRNIINGKRSELARTEPMYVLDGWSAEDYSGWRANLDAINQFYFTDWSDSYAEAFSDRSAKGVIAIAVYREVPPARVEQRLYERAEEDWGASQDASPAAGAAPPVARSERAAEKSAGTGYGERVIDRAQEVEFQAMNAVDARHFIKYEWRETLCRKRLVECGGTNRFWDEGTLGFVSPPPRR